LIPQGGRALMESGWPLLAYLLNYPGPVEAISTGPSWPFSMDFHHIRPSDQLLAATDEPSTLARLLSGSTAFLLQPSYSGVLDLSILGCVWRISRNTPFRATLSRRPTTRFRGSLAVQLNLRTDGVVNWLKVGSSLRSRQWQGSNIRKYSHGLTCYTLTW
jgi:hypothetical protein